ncbi:hypothetical protein J5J83_02970 [Azoarcus sp. L1K30]|uniref:hypothetical protein n=1 Tax=Azoarcus sp. L1K30 TaxID=2820277 RepID=UPI001B831188|nr:hypothetical protein [Azoarcus sp. L1K30]MBR0565077.1 hypothetical protein [Azoarcus sp. L1K30]
MTPTRNTPQTTSQATTNLPPQGVDLRDFDFEGTRTQAASLRRAAIDTFVARMFAIVLAMPAQAMRALLGGKSVTPAHPSRRVSGHPGRAGKTC